MSSSDILASLMEQAKKVIATLDRIALKLADEGTINQCELPLLSPPKADCEPSKPNVSRLPTESSCSYDPNEPQFARSLPGTDAHKVLDKMSDRNFDLNVVPAVKTDFGGTQTREICWKNEVNEEVKLLYAHDVLDEIPLPEFIREMAKTVTFEEETMVSTEYQVFDEFSEPILSLFEESSQDYTLDFGAYNLLDEMLEPNSKVMTFEPQGMIVNTPTQLLISFNEVENEPLICGRKDMIFGSFTWIILGSISSRVFVYDLGALFLFLNTCPPTHFIEFNNGWMANVNYKELHSWGKLGIEEGKYMWELTVEQGDDCIIVILEHCGFFQLIWLKPYNKHVTLHFIVHPLPLMHYYFLASSFSSNSLDILVDLPFCKFGCLFVFSDTRIVGLLMPFYILTLEDKGDFRGEGDKIVEKYSRERFIVVGSRRAKCHKGTGNQDNGDLKGKFRNKTLEELKGVTVGNNVEQKTVSCRNIWVELGSNAIMDYEFYARFNGLPSFEEWDYDYAKQSRNSSNGSSLFKLYESTNQRFRFSVSISTECCSSDCSGFGTCSIYSDSLTLCRCDRFHNEFDCSVRLVPEGEQKLWIVLLVGSNAAAIIPVVGALWKTLFAEINQLIPLQKRFTEMNNQLKLKEYELELFEGRAEQNEHHHLGELVTKTGIEISKNCPFFIQDHQIGPQPTKIKLMDEPVSKAEVQTQFFLFDPGGGWYSFVVPYGKQKVLCSHDKNLCSIYPIALFLHYGMWKEGLYNLELSKRNFSGDIPFHSDSSKLKTCSYFIIKTSSVSLLQWCHDDEHLPFMVWVFDPGISCTMLLKKPLLMLPREKSRVWFKKAVAIYTCNQPGSLMIHVIGAMVTNTRLELCYVVSRSKYHLSLILEDKDHFKRLVMIQSEIYVRASLVNLAFISYCSRH